MTDLTLSDTADPNAMTEHTKHGYCMPGVRCDGDHPQDSCGGPPPRGSCLECTLDKAAWAADQLGPYLAVDRRILEELRQDADVEDHFGKQPGPADSKEQRRREGRCVHCGHATSTSGGRHPLRCVHAACRREVEPVMDPAFTASSSIVVNQRECRKLEAHAPHQWAWGLLDNKKIFECSGLSKTEDELKEQMSKRCPDYRVHEEHDWESSGETFHCTGVPKWEMGPLKLIEMPPEPDFRAGDSVVIQISTGELYRGRLMPKGTVTIIPAAIKEYPATSLKPDFREKIPVRQCEHRESPHRAHYWGPVDQALNPVYACTGLA